MDPLAEFSYLTDRCNANEANADEYLRWCELKAELRSSDLTARRMHDRRDMRLPVELPVTLVLGGQRVESRCVELSAGGMKLAHREPGLERGTRLHVHFHFPEEQEHWRRQGTIVWVRESDGACGVQFDGHPEEEDLRAEVLAECLVRQFPLVR